MDAIQQNEKIWSFYQNEQRDVFLQARPRVQFLVRQIRRIAAQRGTKRLRVLNVGVGGALLESALHAEGWDVAGLDPDQAAIERLRAAGIEGIVGQLPQSGVDAESFDIIVASEVIEHIDRAQLSPSLAEMCRILRPGGLLIGTVPYNEKLADAMVHCPSCGLVFHRWGHQQSFNRDTLRNALQSSFNVQTLSVRAFVDFSGRSIAGFLRGLVRYGVGRMGYSLAAPSIYFEASKAR